MLAYSLPFRGKKEAGRLLLHARLPTRQLKSDPIGGCGLETFKFTQAIATSGRPSALHGLFGLLALLWLMLMFT